MSDTGLTAEEVFDSLTGFDEMAVTQHFGRTVNELADKDQSMFGRALVFVVKRREGATDDEARNTVLGMTMKEYLAVFADSTPEESGKEQVPAEQPASSLSSVS